MSEQKANDQPTRLDSQAMVKPDSRLIPWTIKPSNLVSIAALGLSVCALGLTWWLGHTTLDRQATPQQATLIPNYQHADHSASRRVFGDSENLIADVAENIAPSVVNIDTTKKGGVVQMSPFGFQDDLFERFFGLPSLPQQQFQRPPVRGNGSGVIITGQGHILTNNHVVEGADDITITLKDGRKVKAQVVGKDPLSDIAVLKMAVPDGVKIVPAKIGDSGALRPGQWVIAVGSPLGFDHTVTLGIISAIARQVPDINANVEFIQTDAAINPGNSGGPLVNLHGEVIGINTAIAGSGQNIGFAIPINTAKNVTDDLIKVGRVDRAWIGITMSSLNPELSRSLGLSETTKGVIVAQVMPNSPSEKAGFQPGDVIQRINGDVIATPKQLQEYIRSKPINSPLNVQVLRNGQMVAMTLRTETLPADLYTRQPR